MATLLAVSSSPAQAPSSWVGQRVITRYGTVLKVGKQVVDDERRSNHLSLFNQWDRRYFRVYRVQHVNGGWLWLRAEKEGVEGWVKVRFVIPYDQAMDYFIREIQANPRSFENFLKLGLIWEEKGDHDAAIDYYNDAIRLNPAYEVAYEDRGIAWGRKKEYDKAIADFSAAIQIAPMLVGAYYNRGVAWKAKKEYDKAIADYDTAIRLDPEFADPFNGRAWLWATCPDEKYRDGKKAVDSAIRACELGDWKNAGHIDTLAAAHAETGAFEKAVEFQQKAIRLVADQETKKQFEGRLKLYRDKKPYRDEE